MTIPILFSPSRKLSVCTLLGTLLLTPFSTSFALGASAPAIERSLTPTEKQMIAWVDTRKEQILKELEEHVNINTGTQNIEGLNQYRDLWSAELEQLGFETQKHPSEGVDILSCDGGRMEFADHLSARRDKSIKSEGAAVNILLNGHLDTVFSQTDEFQSLKILPDGTLKGPGVADMKGGLVIMLNALRVLNEFGLLEQANISVLLNTDEEIGSLGSRPLIESMAATHDIGLVFEGSYKNQVTRARKGLGQVRLKIKGRESHSGGAHRDGVSASLELANKIIAIEQLTNYESQSTVNVGVMSGGEKRNTIPGCADAYIDLRFKARAEGQELLDQIQTIADQTFISNPSFPELPETQMWGTLHRPAKPPHPMVDHIIKEATALSHVIGEPIMGTRYAGGGTDGSIAQGAGLPTFDSLGMDGSDAHSSRETSSVATLIARTKLAAVLIARLIDGQIVLAETTELPSDS